MGIIRKSEDQHFIYEHSELAILVALTKDQANLIKQFWKTYKGKSNPPAETVEGHRFIHDEVQESLKIDFEKLEHFEIRHLQKYA